LSCLLLSVSAASLPIDDTTIILGDSAHHRFEGFGVSVSNGGNPKYQSLPAASRQQLAQRLWTDAGARVVRLWLDLHYFNPAAGTYSLTDFQNRYITSGYLADALAAGCDTILLAPTNIPPYLRDHPNSGPADKMALLDDSCASPYGQVLAQAIIMLQQQHGIQVSATGIQNEPSSRVKLSPSQFVLATKALQAALTQAGPAFAAIDIIGPENASVDGTCDSYVQALAADPIAWNATRGIAAHSYNMALKEPFATPWLQSGRDYWNTEAGNSETAPDGSAAPFGPRQGCSLASRAINDLRLGCSRWVWFLGYECATDGAGDQHRLLRFRSDGSIEELPTFHYFRALSQAIPQGSEILPITSSRTLGAWTYGRKPRLYVVAAQRPDGDLAVAISNYSSGEFADPLSGSSFYQTNAGYDAASQRVRLQLDAFEGIVTQASLSRIGFSGSPVNLISADGWIDSASLTPESDGSLLVQVEPMELITLRIHLAAPPSNNPPSVAITGPADQTVIDDGQAVSFNATASDPEDGVLSGSAIQWSSDRDGALGSGSTLTLSGLSTGTHCITAIAADAHGASASACIALTVRDNSPGDGPVVAELTLQLTGRVPSSIVRLVIDGAEVPLDSQGRYNVIVPVTIGQQVIAIELHRADGSYRTRSLAVEGLPLAIQ
jgi:hypothetical protein